MKLLVAAQPSLVYLDVFVLARTTQSSGSRRLCVPRLEGEGAFSLVLALAAPSGFDVGGGDEEGVGVTSSETGLLSCRSRLHFKTSFVYTSVCLLKTCHVKPFIVSIVNMGAEQCFFSFF